MHVAVADDALPSITNTARAVWPGRATPYAFATERSESASSGTLSPWLAAKRLCESTSWEEMPTTSRPAIRGRPSGRGRSRTGACRPRSRRRDRTAARRWTRAGRRAGTALGALQLEVGRRIAQLRSLRHRASRCRACLPRFARAERAGVRAARPRPPRGAAARSCASASARAAPTGAGARARSARGAPRAARRGRRVPARAPPPETYSRSAPASTASHRGGPDALPRDRARSTLRSSVITTPRKRSSRRSRPPTTSGSSTAGVTPSKAA